MKAWTPGCPRQIHSRGPAFGEGKSSSSIAVFKEPCEQPDSISEPCESVADVDLKLGAWGNCGHFLGPEHETAPSRSLAPPDHHVSFFEGASKGGVASLIASSGCHARFKAAALRTCFLADSMANVLGICKESLRAAYVQQSGFNLTRHCFLTALPGSQTWQTCSTLSTWTPATYKQSRQTSHVLKKKRKSVPCISLSTSRLQGQNLEHWVAFTAWP